MKPLDRLSDQEAAQLLTKPGEEVPRIQVRNVRAGSTFRIRGKDVPRLLMEITDPKTCGGSVVVLDGSGRFIAGRENYKKIQEIIEIGSSLDCGIESIPHIAGITQLS